MPKPPRYLKQLEYELLALGDDAMLLEELDGFIAGLLVCPELIKPSEWLPVVWGSEGEDEPAFDSLDHLNRVLGLVMEHYNDIARTLIERPDRYGPRFAVPPQGIKLDVLTKGEHTAVITDGSMRVLLGSALLCSTPYYLNMKMLRECIV